MTIFKKLNRDWKIAIITALVFQVILAIAGLIVAKISDVELINYNYNWDSSWYGNIVANWYVGEAAAPHSMVFYPLFPLVITILKFCTFNLIPVQILGTIVNTVCLVFIVYFIRKICQALFPKRTKLPIWVTVLLLTFHSAFFLHCFYSETLLLAIGLGAYYFAIKRRWALMGILLAFATAIRLPGLLFVGLCGLEFMRAYDYKIKKIFNKNLWWFLLAPLGIVGYMVYLWVICGDPLAMFHAYEGSVWTYHVLNFNIFEVYIRYIQNFFNIFINGSKAGAIIDYGIPLYSMSMILITSLYALFTKKKQLYPLAIFGLAAIVMFSLNSNLVSTNRYAISAVSQFFIIGEFATANNKKWRKVLAAAFILVNVIIMCGYYYGFINTEFVG